MLAGSLLAAIAEARAWRSRWGWASSPTLAARWAKARLAWLGLTGVPRSVRNTRSSWTGWGGRPGSTQRSATVAGWPQGQAQPGLLAAVTAQRLDGEGWQGEDGVAGRGLERPDRQLLAAATQPSAAVAIGVVGEDGGVDDGEGLAEPDGAGVQVQVGPFQAAQLAVAGAGRRGQHRPGAKPGAGGVVGGVQQHRDLLGCQRHHLGAGDRRWGGVGGGVVGEQPPGDRLGQGAVQAAVHGQDVLGGEPARLAVPAAADGQPVVDGLDLQRGELLERPGADGGSDVVAQQRGVAGHGAGAQAGADVGQPAVQVLVDGELGRVEERSRGCGGPARRPGRPRLGRGWGSRPGPRSGGCRRGRGAAPAWGTSGCSGPSTCRLPWGGP